MLDVIHKYFTCLSITHFASTYIYKKEGIRHEEKGCLMLDARVCRCTYTFPIIHNVSILHIPKLIYH